MAQVSRWPSRWWFWGILILGNVYLVVPVVHLMSQDRGSFVGLISPEVEGVVRVLATPAFLFAKYVVMPVARDWQPWQGEAKLIVIALTTWEVAAVVLGLVLYGAVALVHAILPEIRSDGEARTDG